MPNDANDPSVTSAQLITEFEPDPQVIAGPLGGPIDVSVLGNGCSGFARSLPDFSVSYESGREPLLRFYFVPLYPDRHNTTLVVYNSSLGTWLCNDDSWGTLLPTVDVNGPASGRYDVWVATYLAGDTDFGYLYVTERSECHPADSSPYSSCY